MTQTNWSELLTKAITEPGIISEAYSRFHNYSLGNQLLAMFQCIGREIQPGPLGTFMHWKELGRGCSSVNAPPSWIAATIWFSSVTVLIVAGIWFWNQTANRHLLLRAMLSSLAVAGMATLTSGPIMEQYRRENPPKQIASISPASARPVPSIPANDTAKPNVRKNTPIPKPPAVRFGLQLLPCCRKEGEPTITKVSGAALTIQNMTEGVQSSVSVRLSFPVIRDVKIDDTERVKCIDGSCIHGGGNYINLFLHEMAPEEVRHVMIDFAFWESFKSLEDWRKEYKYGPGVVLLGPGLLVIGPEILKAGRK